MKIKEVYEPMELVDMVRTLPHQEPEVRANAIRALSERIGVSYRYVQQIAMLASAPDDLLQLVRDRTISGTLLYELGMHYSYRWEYVRLHVSKALRKAAKVKGPKRGRVTLAALNAIGKGK